MTNEEAIKWLKDIHHRFNPTGEILENEGGDVHLQALKMAIEALRQTEWIPVSKRLPVKNRLVLVTAPYKCFYPVTVARCNGGKWHFAGYTYPDGDVVAWMPLPDLYREEDEE